MAFDWDLITRDFQQKYEKSFIRIKLKDKFEIFWLNQVKQEKEPYLILKNKNYGEIHLNYKTTFEINFEYPQVGIFNSDIDLAAYCFVKRYERQWKRGLSDHTILIKNPYSFFIDIKEFILTEELLSAAFEPRTDVSITTAVDKLNKNEYLSQRLNNTFLLGLDVRKKDTFLLWYMEDLIGEIVDKEIILHEPQFKQEIKDYLRNIEEREYYVTG